MIDNKTMACRTVYDMVGVEQRAAIDKTLATPVNRVENAFLAIHVNGQAGQGGNAPTIHL